MTMMAASVIAALVFLPVIVSKRALGDAFKLSVPARMIAQKTHALDAARGPLLRSAVSEIGEPVERHRCRADSELFEVSGGRHGVALHQHDQLVARDGEEPETVEQCSRGAHRHERNRHDQLPPPRGFRNPADDLGPRQLLAATQFKRFADGGVAGQGAHERLRYVLDMHRRHGEGPPGRQPGEKGRCRDGRANHLVTKLRAKLHAASRVAKDHRRTDDGTAQATAGEVAFGPELRALVRRAVLPDAVRAHQQEAIHLPRLRRVTDAASTLVMHRPEGNPGRRVFPQNADQVDRRLASLECRIDRRPIVNLARNHPAPPGVPNRALAPATHQQTWLMPRPQQCIDQVAAHKPGPTKHRNAHTRRSYLPNTPNGDTHQLRPAGSPEWGHPSTSTGRIAPSRDPESGDPGLGHPLTCVPTEPSWIGIANGTRTGHPSTFSGDRIGTTASQDTGISSVFRSGKLLVDPI